jgi:hypothetical protein
MINMVLDIVNRWSVSEKRWGRDHHDHAMQIASVRIPIFTLPPQRMLPARIAAHYRDPRVRSDSLNDLYDFRDDVTEAEQALKTARLEHAALGYENALDGSQVAQMLVGSGLTVY